MDISRIVQLIESPENLKFSDKYYIENIIATYPFSQSFHLLYLIWKQIFTSEPLDQDIQKVSIYTAYREILKKHIENNKNIVKKVNIDEREEEKDKTKQVEGVIISKNIEFKECMEEKDKVRELIETHSTYEDTINEKNISEKLLSDSFNKLDLEPVQNIYETKSLLSEDNELKKENSILFNDCTYTNIEKLGISHLFKSDSQVELEKDNEGNEEEYKLEQKNNYLPEQDFLEEKIEKSRDLDIEKIIKEETSENEFDKIETIEIEKEEIISGLDKLTFNQWISLSKQKIPLKSESEKVSNETDRQNAIISNFIESNPKIRPIVKDSKSSKSIEFKKEEIQDIANLMTITLAQLYVEQGKYDTAITAFKILSLKYPEKSSYFASEIKKIKKIKNSK